FKGKILVVTAGLEENEAAELIRIGISGIFMKHNSAALLTQGIRDVMAGKGGVDPKNLLSPPHCNTKPLPQTQNERVTPPGQHGSSSVFLEPAHQEDAPR